MMKQKRNNVFIWPSLLSKLVAGEQMCEFQSWFKAHFQYDKKPSNFNLMEWNVKHTQLLHKRRDKLAKEGYIVKVEGQNKFKLKCPKGVIVSGKADIVAIEEVEDEQIAGLMHKCYVVEDCKTGKPLNSHLVQVMMYMMFIPSCLPEYENVKLDGNVVYAVDDVVPISWTDIDSNLKEWVWSIIKKIGGSEPCRKVPCEDECRYCDIPKEDCPERIE